MSKVDLRFGLFGLVLLGPSFSKLSHDTVTLIRFEWYRLELQMRAQR